MTATERKPPGLGHRARYMSPDRTSERIAALRPTAVNMIMAEVRALPDLPRQPVSLMRGEPDLPTPLPRLRYEAAVRVTPTTRGSRLSAKPSPARSNERTASVIVGKTRF